MHKIMVTGNHSARLIRQARILVFASLPLLLVTDIRGAELKSQLRRPVAGVVVNGDTIAIANQASGSVSLFNWKTGKVLSELSVGERLSAIAKSSDNRLLVTDESRGECVTLNYESETLKVESRLSVAPHPVEIATAKSGDWFVVSSLWPRQLTVVSLAAGQPPAVQATIKLPFSPRNLLVLDDDRRIVVADAFGGQIGLVKFDIAARFPANLSVESVRSLPAHNIRHLALAGTGERRRLHISHQILNELARPVEDDIHWGMFVGNGIRSVPVSVLLNPAERLLKGAEFQSVGDAGRGAGDPEEFVVTKDGRTVVAVAGSNRLAIIEKPGHPENQIDTHARPTSLLQVGPQQVVVLNRFADSVSVADIRTPTANARANPSASEQTNNTSSKTDGYSTDAAVSAMTVFPEVQIKQQTYSLGPAPELNAVQRGEVLFHSARLSHDGWFSCHSCHTDGHSNGQLADTLSDGSFGAAKRVLSLRGIANTEPLAWNGSLNFESQIQKSVHNTMQGGKLSADDTADLVAYVKSLPPIPSAAQLGNRIDPAVVGRGRKVFEKNGCAKCHAGEVFTSAQTYDVGLTDEVNTIEFNPPSLRGVSHRPRLFHDNRAATLAEVFTKFKHPGNVSLSSQELQELLAYLRSL